MTQYTYSLLIFLLIVGCKAAPIPKWGGKFYAGNSKESEITRAQDDEHIKTNDPAFDKYVCMSYVDLESFYKLYVLGCKTWKHGPEMVRPQDQLVSSSPFGKKE